MIKLIYLSRLLMGKKMNLKKILIGGTIAALPLLGLNNALAQQNGPENERERITEKYDSLRNSFTESYNSLPAEGQEEFGELYKQAISIYDANESLRLQSMEKGISRDSDLGREIDNYIERSNSIFQDYEIGISLRNVLNPENGNERDQYRIPNFEDFEYTPLFPREEGEDSVDTKELSREIIFGKDPDKK